MHIKKIRRNGDGNTLDIYNMTLSLLGAFGSRELEPIRYLRNRPARASSKLTSAGSMKA